MKAKEKEMFAKEDWEKDDKDGDYSKSYVCEICGKNITLHEYKKYKCFCKEHKNFEQYS